MNIGKKIAERRKNVGLTQKELADAVYVSVGMIAQIEGGYKMPSIPLCDRIAAKLGCTLIDILC